MEAEKHLAEQLRETAIDIAASTARGDLALALGLCGSAVQLAARLYDITADESWRATEARYHAEIETLEAASGPTSAAT